MSNVDDLIPTPMRNIKPKLVYFGQVIGMDLYIDVGHINQPEDRYLLAQKIMKEMFETKFHEDES